MRFIAEKSTCPLAPPTRTRDIAGGGANLFIKAYSEFMNMHAGYQANS